MLKWTVLLIVIGCMLYGCTREEPEPINQTNVVLISIDTLRADHLSLYGYHRKTSPHLEELARDSTVFNRVYAHSPWTLTSHMSLMTSLFPLAHGAESKTRISRNIPTLAETLKDAGYATAGFYAQSWLDPKFGFGRGFDVYEAYDFGDDGLAATSEFLDEWAKSQKSPFFLFLHFRDVHTAPMGKDPGFLYNSPPEFRDSFLPYPEISKPFIARDVWEGRTSIDEQELANVVARYDGGILYVDFLIDKLIDKLRDLDAYDDSLIVITSDHGESLGDRGRITSHGGMFEEGLRIPLIVKLPRSHPEAQRLRDHKVDYPVQTVDIAPAILNALGIESPSTFQGKDLFSKLERDIVGFRNNRAVLIRGNQKLNMAIESDGSPPSIRLYDLQADPGETHPLHNRDKPLADSLRMALEEHLQDHRDLFEKLSDSANTSIELEPEKIERLKAMGYLY